MRVASENHDATAQANGHRIIDECMQCMKRRPLDGVSLLCTDCATEVINGEVIDQEEDV